MDARSGEWFLSGMREAEIPAAARMRGGPPGMERKI